MLTQKNEEFHFRLVQDTQKAAGAVQIADVYADRWTIETGFQHLTDDLRCEIDTLGYPKVLAQLRQLAVWEGESCHI